MSGRLSDHSSKIVVRSNRLPRGRQNLKETVTLRYLRRAVVIERLREGDFTGHQFRLSCLCRRALIPVKSDSGSDAIAASCDCASINARKPTAF